ncbi:hypothetical protein LRS06_20495 [Hymenobacter sp. J193]|uniref:hypothetical protein n=1 Tax=Hymenobacter sp. J193 TaxID=2898429 RepID=UPI0021506C4B|nr:hypothetical protein [Hymenobacter sp. J193]MCR5890109.1 hypothetical protein [Hymenobacter sp. J193]
MTFPKRLKALQLVFCGFLFCGLLPATPGVSQQGFPRYYEYLGLLSKADSLTKVRQYRLAAALYGQAARVRIERAFPSRPPKAGTRPPGPGHRPR